MAGYIWAYNEAGQGTPAYMAYDLDTSIKVPTKPHIDSVDFPDSQSLLVKFDTVFGNAQTYRVSTYPNGPSCEVTDPQATQGQCLLEGVDQSRGYDLSLTTFNTEGSVTSNIFKVASAPTSLSARLLNGTQAELQWVKSKHKDGSLLDSVAPYRVEKSVDNAPWEPASYQVLSDETDVVSTRISNLVPGIQTRFRVSCLCAPNSPPVYSDVSTAIVLMDPVPSAPLNLRASDVPLAPSDL